MSDYLEKKKKQEGFPGGAVVESPPADAGNTGSCPGLGRSHMPRSGWAREPWPLSLRVRSLCSATGEATTVRGLCNRPPPQKSTKNINLSRLSFVISSNLLMFYPMFGLSLLFDFFSKSSYITWLLPYLFGAVPRSYLRGCLPRL